MAITTNRSSHKSPSQDPTSFFKGKQSGGATGNSSYKAPQKLPSGTMREKIMGDPKKS